MTFAWRHCGGAVAGGAGVVVNGARTVLTARGRASLGNLCATAGTCLAIANARESLPSSRCYNPSDVVDNLDARRVQTQTRVLTRIATGVLDHRRHRLRPDDVPAGAPVRRQPARLGRAWPALVHRHRRALGVQQPARRPADRAVAADPHRRRADRRRRMGPRRGDHRHLRRAQDLGRAAARDPAAVVHRASVPELDAHAARRSSAASLLWVDYTTALEPLRAEATRSRRRRRTTTAGSACCRSSTRASASMQLRLIVSSASARPELGPALPAARRLIAFLQREQPHALPRVRAELQRAEPAREPRAQGSTRVPHRRSCTRVSPAPSGASATTRR